MGMQRHRWHIITFRVEIKTIKVEPYKASKIYNIFAEYFRANNFCFLSWITSYLFFGKYWYFSLIDWFYSCTKTLIGLKCHLMAKNRIICTKSNAEMFPYKWWLKRWPIWNFEKSQLIATSSLAPSQQQLKPSDPVPPARITPSGYGDGAGDWRMGGSSVSAARWTISMVDRCEIRFALAFDVTRDRTGGATTINKTMLRAEEKLSVVK